MPSQRVADTDTPEVDNRFSRALEAFLEIIVYLILKMFGVIVLSPIFIFPALLVAIGGVICGNIYMKAQLCVKRELSTVKAPVLGHFGAAISGISEYDIRSLRHYTNELL